MDNWWGRGYGYWGGGGWWGAGGYNNININNIQNNVINWKPGARPPGWQPGERPGRPGERPGIRPGERPGRPSTLPAERRNLYNRPGNENRLASRPGQPATRPGGGVAPGRPGLGAGERPAARPERPPQGTRPKAETRPAQAARPAQPQVRPARGKNDVLADRNGNLYRRDPQGNWQQRQGGQWSRPEAANLPATRPAPGTRPAARPERPAATPGLRPAPSQPSFNPATLNRDFQARQRGQQRVQNFQHSNVPSRPGPSVSRPSGGGGGRPAGGVSRPSGGGGGGGRPAGGGGGGGRRR